MNIFDIQGKTALITGSGEGLGYILSKGLAKAGATVILNGRNEKKLKNTAKEFTGLGYQVHYYVFDITKSSEVHWAVKKIEQAVGPIDILINNAGIQIRKPLEDFSEKNWNEIINTNLTGAFIVSKAVVQGMIKRQAGKIINICSLMSEVGRPTIAPYAAAKGGLKMLTRAMTVEWAKYNIQVNAIGPGYFITDMTKSLAEDPNFDNWIKRRTPAGRWGKPDELIGTTLYLASAASNFVNGQIIYVDGGILAAL